MGNKFSIAAADVNSTIKRVYVAALRQGLADGFEEVVHTTKQDSSNAVVHWMLGATDGSNSANRALAAPTDLRGFMGARTRTLSNGKISYGGARIRRAPKHPWVGYRYDERSAKQPGVAIAVADKVLAREAKLAIDKYARGQLPATDFYFYNVFLDESGQDKGHIAENARLKEAGEAGLRRAVASFEREISLGNELKRARA